MKRKKLHIDRMDGAVAAVGLGSGSSSGSGTSAPVSGGGSSSGSSAPVSGGSSFGSSTGSPSGSASGSVISGGASGSSAGSGTAGGSADISVDIGTTDKTGDGASVMVSGNSSTGNNRNSTYTIEAGIVTFSDGDSITTGDLVAIIQDYYHVEKVDDSRIASALEDPDFLAYLKKKIKRKKMKPITLNDTKQGVMQAFGSLAPKGETDEPAAGAPDTSDSWTFLGVTMKKGYWIFMAAGLAMLLFILAIVAILKRK